MSPELTPTATTPDLGPLPPGSEAIGRYNENTGMWGPGSPVNNSGNFINFNPTMTQNVSGGSLEGSPQPSSEPRRIEVATAPEPQTVPTAPEVKPQPAPSPAPEAAPQAATSPEDEESEEELQREYQNYLGRLGHITKGGRPFTFDEWKENRGREKRHEKKEKSPRARRGEKSKPAPEEEGDKGDLEKRMDKLEETLAQVLESQNELNKLIKQLLEERTGKKPDELTEKDLPAGKIHEPSEDEGMKRMETHFKSLDGDEDEEGGGEGTPPPAEPGEDPKKRRSKIWEWFRHPVRRSYSWINTRGVGRDKDGEPIVPAVPPDKRPPAEPKTEEEKKRNRWWLLALPVGALATYGAYKLIQQGIDVPFFGDGGDGGADVNGGEGADTNGEAGGGAEPGDERGPEPGQHREYWPKLPGEISENATAIDLPNGVHPVLNSEGKVDLVNEIGTVVASNAEVTPTGALNPETISQLENGNKYVVDANGPHNLWYKDEMGPGKHGWIQHPVTSVEKPAG